jgi:hypothetical protein
MESRELQPLTIFCCGHGNSEKEVSGDSLRQGDLGMRGSQTEERDARAVYCAGVQTFVLLNAVKVGASDTLVAIRLLDVRIDVPAFRTA